MLGGLVAAQTHIADRVVAELLGPGDLLQPPADDGDDRSRIASWASWRPPSGRRSRTRSGGSPGPAS
jgi:hypothetical protein